MKKIVFIKLGGSVITDKKVPFKLRKNVLQKLAKEISLLSASNQLVLANGGGSYVHPVAKKYGLVSGIKGKLGLVGLSKLQVSTMKLNQIVAEALQVSGTKVFPLSPSSFIFSGGKTVKNFFLVPFVQLVNLGMTPLVYGSPVLDSKTGVADFSTERIIDFLITNLPKNFKAKMVIHVGETDGVYNASGKTIPLITKDNVNEVKSSIFETGKIDVSGGMLHKIEECLKLSQKGVKCVILNGNRKGELKRAIEDKPVYGTIIRYA